MKKTSVKDITKFREAIKNVVSMLVARNIPVIERGDKAYVEYNKAGEPLCICIPSIPDDASDKFLMAIRGFIDHEVAHVLFTDSTKATSFVWNAVEDTFIERKMGEMFKGSRANLINTQKHVIDTVFIPKEMEAIAEKLGDQTRMFMEFYLVPVLRAWNDQTPFIDYMEDRWESVKEPVSILIKHGVDKMIPKISSTSDSVAVAALIVRLLVDKPMESKEPDGSDSKEKGKGNRQANRPKTIVVVAAICPGMMSLTSKNNQTHLEMGRKRVPRNHPRAKEVKLHRPMQEMAVLLNPKKTKSQMVSGTNRAMQKAERVIFPNQQKAIWKSWSRPNYQKAPWICLWKGQ
jgi:hypothetical protein